MLLTYYNKFLLNINDFQDCSPYKPHLFWPIKCLAYNFFYHNEHILSAMWITVLELDRSPVFSGTL